MDEIQEGINANEADNAAKQASIDALLEAKKVNSEEIALGQKLIEKFQ